MTYVLTVQMLKFCSSQTDVYIQLCVRVLYALIQCCPLTLFRDSSMVDTDLLPS